MKKTGSKAAFRCLLKYMEEYIGFTGGSVVKNLPANAGGSGGSSLIPGSGRSPGEGNGNPLKYSCLKISWTVEPGRLQSMGSQRVEHDRGTSLSLSAIVFLYEHIYTVVTFHETDHFTCSANLLNSILRFVSESRIQSFLPFNGHLNYLTHIRKNIFNRKVKFL